MKSGQAMTMLLAAGSIACACFGEDCWAVVFGGAAFVWTLVMTEAEDWDQ